MRIDFIFYHGEFQGNSCSPPPLRPLLALFLFRDRFELFRVCYNSGNAAWIHIRVHLPNRPRLLNSALMAFICNNNRGANPRSAFETVNITVFLLPSHTRESVRAFTSN